MKAMALFIHIFLLKKLMGRLTKSNFFLKIILVEYIRELTLQLDLLLILIKFPFFLSGQPAWVFIYLFSLYIQYTYLLVTGPTRPLNRHILVYINCFICMLVLVRLHTTILKATLGT